MLIVWNDSGGTGITGPTGAQGIGRDLGDMTYDPKTNNLIVTWADDNATQASYVSVVNPSNGIVSSTYTTGVTTAGRIYQCAIGPDNACYAILGSGSSTTPGINALNVTYTGTSGSGSFDVPTTYSVGHGPVQDMSDWICQPVLL